jgi:hypothetical protein
VIVINLVAALICIAAIGYMIWALVKPEKF